MSPEALALSLVGLASGIPLSVSEGQNVRHGLASRYWPRVQGVVLERGVHVGTASIGDETAVVVYEYEFAGQRYTSRRVDYSGRATARTGGHRRTFARYPAGASIDVYVDPRQPSRAVLDPGIGAGTIVRLAVGLTLLGSGLVALLAGLRAPGAG